MSIHATVSSVHPSCQQMIFTHNIFWTNMYLKRLQMECSYTFQLTTWFSPKALMGLFQPSISSALSRSCLTVERCLSFHQIFGLISLKTLRGRRSKNRRSMRSCLKSVTNHGASDSIKLANYFEYNYFLSVTIAYECSAFPWWTLHYFWMDW